MNYKTINRKPGILMRAILLYAISTASHADVIMDWNVTACTIVVESNIYTPPANPVMAIVHTAIYESVKSVSQTPKLSQLNKNDRTAVIETTVTDSQCNSIQAWSTARFIQQPMGKRFE